MHMGSSLNEGSLGVLVIRVPYCFGNPKRDPNVDRDIPICCRGGNMAFCPMPMWSPNGYGGYHQAAESEILIS